MKNLCFVDWLSVTYVLTDLSYTDKIHLTLNCPTGYILEDLEGTNTFSSRYIVSDLLGVKKLTILANPKSGIISPDLAHIQFANSTLYSGEFVDLLEKLHLFHNGYVHSISRLDVCCDFQYFIDENNEYKSGEDLAIKLIENLYYVKGKQAGASFFDLKLNNEEKVYKVPKQISYGGSGSQIKWKLYNKSKEIKEESKKYYISKIHEANGFDMTKDVWRLEVSLTKCQNMSIEDEDHFNYLSLSYLLKAENVYKFFVLMSNRSFQVKCNDGQKNKSRNRKVPLFNIESFDVRIVKYHTDDSMVRSSVKSLVHSSVKALTDLVIQHNKNIFDNISLNLIDLVECYDLGEYFSFVYKDHVRNYVQSIKNTLKNSEKKLKKEEKKDEFQFEIKFK